MPHKANSGSFIENAKLTYKSGDRYGYLMLTGKSYKELYGGCIRRFVECICDCGKTIYTRYQDVRGSLVKSCGCKKRAFLLNMITIHGFATDENKHPLYVVWGGMKDRCYNPDNINYHNYGGRGIIVCDEWLNNPAAFIEWGIANGWEDGLSIDRENNDGIYEPSNCRFATNYVQMRNRRNNRFLTAFGETKCFNDWVRDVRCKVAHGTLFYRLTTLKWESEMAISKPPKYST